MPVVRYLGGGGYYIRDGPEFDAGGDEADVGERTADRLTARGDFELVEAETNDFGVAEAHPLSADIDSRDELREEMVATVESGTVPEVSDAIAAGEYDNHLNLLAEVETSFGGDRKGVHSAIDARRDDLE